MAQCMHGRGTDKPCISGPLPGSAFCAAHRQAGAPDPGPAKNSVDPEVVGSKIATVWAAQEHIARKKLSNRVRRNEDGTRQDELPRAPFRVFTRRQRPDRSSMVDPVTQKRPECIPEGWVTRWVRTRDHENRPTMMRVGEFEDFGYQPVTDQNGETIETPLGLAMMAPPEAYGERVREKQPPGAVFRDDALDAALDIEGDINRIAGEGAANVVTEADHGRRRTLEGPGAVTLVE